MKEEDSLAMSFQMGQLWSAIKTIEEIDWEYGLDSPDPEKRTTAALAGLKKAYNQLAIKRWQMYQERKDKENV